MSKTPIFLTVIVIFCLGTSCEKKEELVYIKARNIIPSDTIELVYPQNYPFKEPGNSWTSNDSSISFLSETPFQINTFNLRSNKWFKTPLEFQGPDGLKSIGAFSFVNSDTLIYFPKNIQEYYLISEEGKKLKTYKIHEVNTQYKSNVYQNPSIWHQKDIIAYPSSKFSDPTKINYTLESRLVTKYNKRTGLEKAIIQYPTEYKNNIWSSNNRKYSVLFEENRILMNFSKSHFIHAYDYEGRLLYKKSAHFDGIRNAKPLNTKYSPIETAIEREFIGYYSNLIYNPHLKQYYRIGISYDRKGDLNNLTMQELQRIYPSRKISVLVLNADLKHVETYVLHGVVENSISANENGLVFESLIDDDIEDTFHYLYYSFK